MTISQHSPAGIAQAVQCWWLSICHSSVGERLWPKGEHDPLLVPELLERNPNHLISKNGSILCLRTSNVGYADMLIVSSCQCQVDFRELEPSIAVLFTASGCSTFGWRLVLASQCHCTWTSAWRSFPSVWHIPQTSLRRAKWSSWKGEAVSKANNEMDEIGKGIQDIQTIGYVFFFGNTFNPRRTLEAIYKNMFLDLYSECAKWFRSILFCLVVFLFSGFFSAWSHQCQGRSPSDLQRSQWDLLCREGARRGLQPGVWGDAGSAGHWFFKGIFWDIPSIMYYTIFIPFIYHMGMSGNGVYQQWNSHLVGIMISKTIGFFGLAYFQTNPYVGMGNGGKNWVKHVKIKHVNYLTSKMLIW